MAYPASIRYAIYEVRFTTRTVPINDATGVPAF